MEASSEPVRIDKWLWAARLMKTRALAAEAVKGGLVHVNGHSVKPSRDVGPGDVVRVPAGHDRKVVVVRATAHRRGPASVAETLYDETDESVALREERADERRAAWALRDARAGRPTKRDRREIERVLGKPKRR